MNRLVPSLLEGYCALCIRFPAPVLAILYCATRVSNRDKVKVLDDIGCAGRRKGWTAAAPPRVQKHAVNRTWKVDPTSTIAQCTHHRTRSPQSAVRTHTAWR